MKDSAYKRRRRAPWKETNVRTIDVKEIKHDNIIVLVSFYLHCCSDVIMRQTKSKPKTGITSASHLIRAGLIDARQFGSDATLAKGRRA